MLGYPKKNEIPGRTTNETLHVDSKGLQYVLKYGVTHLCAGGMEVKAQSLILDVAWLMARAELKAGHDIILDCERLGENCRAVERVGRAVGLALNALRSDPRQLVGQLVGRLGGPTIVAEQQQHNDSVRNSLSELVQRLQNYDYG